MYYVKRERLYCSTMYVKLVRESQRGKLIPISSVNLVRYRSKKITNENCPDEVSTRFIFKSRAR